MFPDRIEQLLPTWTDGPYGTFPDWDNPIVTAIDVPVWIQPLTSTEYYDGLGTIQIVTGYRLISAPGKTLDLKADDRIRKVGESQVYFLDGNPAQWGRPLPHTDAKLQVFEGMGGA